ncbi:GNAT family N-acetyltransferase [Planktotalea arctica]|uniref:GNAT family N-acetyltransferase n=1 Tax=Planktotalea arctica TaxID=1481893 RepID=UPI003CCBD435
MNDMTRDAQPVITTQRLSLRPLQTSDLGLINLHSGDARVAKMTTDIPHPLPPGATEALLKRAADPMRSEDFWAMDASVHGGSELMGLISLTRLDSAQSEIGYWVAPAFWNAGTASDAVAALIDANPLANKTIFAAVFQNNPASAKVLTNAGFDYIGDAETYSVARAANVPTWTYLRKLG